LILIDFDQLIDLRSHLNVGQQGKISIAFVVDIASTCCDLLANASFYSDEDALVVHQLN
jgi:hypothetical protein